MTKKGDFKKMIQLTLKDLLLILNRGGASIDFKTGKDTKKQGFIVSVKDTEAIIKNVTSRDIKEVLNEVNEVLKTSVYNPEVNKNNLLGFWIENNDLFIDVSKCLKVDLKNIYKVKNEAFINNQYAVYNNETGETFRLIIPIYTLYNTSDLLGKPSADTIATYSQDFYTIADVKKFLGITTDGGERFIFESVDDVPEDYNLSKIVIKDLSNYTRDILEDDASLSLADALKYSRLIKEEF